MSRFLKIIKYEFVNILRNKWVFIYAALIAGVSFAFIRVVGDLTKAMVGLSSIAAIVVPLISILFATVYWYYSDRFTELLLTQPMRRSSLFFARWLAVCVSLSGSFVTGIAVPFALQGGGGIGLLLLLVTGIFLTTTFVTVGILIAVVLPDRMRGIGAALAIWFYFATLHDGIVLLVLLAFRDYPLDLVSAILGSMNPIGLTRVVALAFYDASLLLGHTGALVRDLLTHWYGAGLAALVALIWMVFPGYLGLRRFIRKDF